MGRCLRHLVAAVEGHGPDAVTQCNSRDGTQTNDFARLKCNICQRQNENCALASPITDSN